MEEFDILEVVSRMGTKSYGIDIRVYPKVAQVQIRGPAKEGSSAAIAG